MSDINIVTANSCISKGKNYFLSRYAGNKGINNH
jgi:hypothetical protein